MPDISLIIISGGQTGVDRAALDVAGNGDPLWRVVPPGTSNRRRTARSEVPTKRDTQCGVRSTHAMECAGFRRFSHSYSWEGLWWNGPGRHFRVGVFPADLDHRSQSTAGRDHYSSLARTGKDPKPWDRRAARRIGTRNLPRIRRLLEKAFHRFSGTSSERCSLVGSWSDQCRFPLARMDQLSK